MINVVDESQTYLAGWSTRKGERFISTWLTIYESERAWFDQQMTKRFGNDWQDKQEQDCE